ncbi:3-phosphoshikimate 1-carboxyvinyltransferase [soil metagenome]
MSASHSTAGARTTTEVTVPGDKSLTHRALLFAALADGRSRIRAPLQGADTESTAAALRQLGCPVPPLDAAGDVVIDGVGLRGLRQSAAMIDCGNSGTTARLLMGILAGSDFESTLTGDASLCSRPMRRVTEPLSRMGATFEELDRPDRLPIRMRGGELRSIDYTSPHASAQVKSAVLLAALTAGVTAVVSEPVLSRDHTERMLARLGVPLRSSVSSTGVHVEISPVPRLDPLDFDVPGDFSSAAFIIAFACLHSERDIVIRNVGINPTRIGFLRVLEQMQAKVQVENVRDVCGEPVADLRASVSPLVAARITAADVPSLVDEIPIIAILAARAAGTTIIEGAQELRVKESDRISAMVANLRAIGVDASELPDGMVISGTDRPLAGNVRVLHDHRIALAFGVLTAVEDDRVQVDDPSVVQVSFPGYWDLLQGLRLT